jgi:hypothetical protein
LLKEKKKKKKQGDMGKIIIMSSLRLKNTWNFITCFLNEVEVNSTVRSRSLRSGILT